MTGSPLRCLTVIQPWATLIVLGAKRVETRGWPPPATGIRLGIHASSRWSPSQAAFARDRPAVREALEAGGHRPAPGVSPGCLPLGALIGTVTLAGFADKDAMDARSRDVASAMGWGDGDHGRYAWLLLDATRWEVPLSMPGRPGMWPAPPGTPVPRHPG